MIVNLFASAAQESVRDMQNNRDTTSSYKDSMLNWNETHWNTIDKITTSLLILSISSFWELIAILTETSTAMSVNR